MFSGLMAATHHSSGDERLTPRRKALAGLGICLIVPLSAGFGLTVPLPDVVERVAGSLLSGRQLLAFDGEVVDGSRQGVSIVLTPEERAASEGDRQGAEASGADETVVLPDAGSTTGGQGGRAASGEVHAAGSVDGEAVAVDAIASAEAAGSAGVPADQTGPVEGDSSADALRGESGSGGGNPGGRP
jgi:hypothetical protein